MAGETNDKRSARQIVYEAAADAAQAVRVTIDNLRKRELELAHVIKRLDVPAPWEEVTFAGVPLAREEGLEAVPAGLQGTEAGVDPAEAGGDVTAVAPVPRVAATAAAPLEPVGRMSTARLTAMAVETETVDPGDYLGVVQAIQRVEARLTRPLLPNEVVRIVVPQGRYLPFDWNHLSPHDPRACGAKLGAAHLFIHGPSGARRALFDHGKPIPGGDSFPLRPLADGARVSFFGCDFESRGRTVMLTHPKTSGHGMRLAFGSCDFYTRQVGSDDRNWGIQAYSTTVEAANTRFLMPRLLEHPVYVHGHGGDGGYFSGCTFDGFGGNAIQYTQRPSESPTWRRRAVLIEDTTITNGGRFARRAGSAITFAAAGLDVMLRRVRVIDLDDQDTDGQTGTDIGTNYGALAVWLPGSDATTDPIPPYGNGEVEIDECVFAIKNGNRPLVEVSAAAAVALRGGVMLGTTPVSLRSAQRPELVGHVIVAPDVNDRANVVRAHEAFGLIPPAELRVGGITLAHGAAYRD